jgi:hypothetical protein
MSTNEEIELLKTVVRRLESAGIEYMITGSMVLSLYATPRMTRDIDIVIQVSIDDADRITGLFQDDFYITLESVKDAIRNNGMFNIIHNDSIIKVDLIVRKNEEYRKEEFSRKQIADFGGMPVYVVAPEDLILSKLVWAEPSQSELQYRDVRLMLVSCKTLDFEYLKKWAKTLGVNDSLSNLSNDLQAGNG